MTATRLDQITSHPAYKELVSKRTGFSLKLAIAMLVVYFAFIGLIAFDKAVLGASLSGGVTTVGIVVGLAIIVFSFVLTGVYTKRANTEFDDLSNKIKEDIARSGE
jgi:uncharacterized membrane protein (DUF485 family)